MARKPKIVAPSLPASHLIASDKLGLRVVCYLDKAVLVRLEDGEERNEWLPRDLVGRDGNSLIVYREPDRHYSIAGWEPWHDGQFGGRRESILSALAWIERAKDVRAGRADSFLGV